MVRWSAVLVAVTSAVAHVLVLATGPTPSSLHVVAVLGMAMGCLPCAMHLALLPRRRAWAQTVVVPTVVLVGHLVLSVTWGAGHHASTGPAGGGALVVAPVVGLALAVAGLVLGGLPAGGRPLSRARGRARSRVRPSARARARG